MSINKCILNSKTLLDIFKTQGAIGVKRFLDKIEVVIFTTEERTLAKDVVELHKELSEGQIKFEEFEKFLKRNFEESLISESDYFRA